MTTSETVPVWLYAKPNGLVNIVLVELESPWVEIGSDMACLGVEYSVEKIEGTDLYIISAEYGDELLVYEFSDLKDDPITWLVKQAYAAFMTSVRNRPIVKHIGGTMNSVTVPLCVYVPPRGMVTILDVELEPIWAEIGRSMAHLGVRYSVELIPALGTFLAFAEYDGRTLVRYFTNLEGTPCTELVQKAYSAFMNGSFMPS